MPVDFVLNDPEFPPSRLPIPLIKATQVLGRSSQCDLVVKDISVSRRHAELTVSGASVLVTDLGSHNGTFIEEMQITKAELLPGQRVRFGTVLFRLSARDPERLAEFSEEDTGSCLPTPAPAPVRQLTDAQRRVFFALVEGLSEKQIAARLDISRHTVHNHIRAVYRVFGVHSRSELLASFVPRETDND